MAIGLQEVDNLKSSKYLEKLIHENVTGEKTIYEVEKELKEYYTEKNNDYEYNYLDDYQKDLVNKGFYDSIDFAEDDYMEPDNYFYDEDEERKK